ncbi:MAG: MaoC family dehydratase [Nitrososphaerota archaeon]
MMQNEEGPFFEDFKPGMKFRSDKGRTVTDADNIWFTLLTNNTNQIHFNKDYAERYFPGEPFKGRMVVNGFFTLSTVVGLLVEFTSANGFMLGLDGLKFVSPVFSGDTIYAECEVTEIRESKSRPEFGIVKVYTAGFNQRGEKLLEFFRTFMVRRRNVKWEG